MPLLPLLSLSGSVAAPMFPTSCPCDLQSAGPAPGRDLGLRECAFGFSILEEIQQNLSLPTPAMGDPQQGQRLCPWILDLQPPE